MSVLRESDLLTSSMLQRFWERAPAYDRENRFFAEDFEDLKRAGYLTAAVPQELGGKGMTLAEMAQQQRLLAYYAPATALAVNMHIYWCGLISDMWRAGDKSLAWVLEEAAAGKVFAAGHAESGNDIPILLSTTKAERVDGGYTFTGRKSFGSLTPVWDYFGVHGLDASDPDAPQVVHGFMPRGTEGSKIVETWDVLGMRATRSDDTVLEGAFVPDDRIGRVVPAGAAGLDPFVLGLFAWALIGFGNIYYGLARRVLDMTIESVKGKRAMALTRSMAYHPGMQHGIAQMALDLEPVGPHLDRVAQEWSDGADYGAGWVVKIFAAKHCAVEASWRAVDRSLDLVGGFGIFNKGQYARLFRDARLGRLHPANPLLTHEIIGKLMLGINPDEQPRWG